MKTAAGFGRERKVLIMERGSARQPDQRIALHFLKAHPRMSRCGRDRRAQRLEALQTSAMAVEGLPPHPSKPRFVENSIGSNCCSAADQGAVEAEPRTAVARRRTNCVKALPVSPPMLLECPWRWAGVRFGPLV